MTATGSTAVTRTNGKGIVALIESAAPRLTPLLPEGLSIEKLQQIVYFESKKNPALLQCSGESIVSAVARLLRSGLELGETAYLVPFGSTCTFVAGYTGLAQLMIAARVVRAIEMEAVREGDMFEFELGLESKLRHQPVNGGSRKITHAYVILRLPGGMSTFKVMAAEEIDAIRLKHSKQWAKGPLPAWYAVKTVIRQIAKTMPKDKRLAAFYAALESDEREEFGSVQAAENERPATVDADGVDRSAPQPYDEMSDAELLSEDDAELDQEIQEQDRRVEQQGLGIPAEQPRRAKSAQSQGR